jgi:hypothetical protein
MQFHEFATYEQSGVSIRADIRILWIYELGGKYAVLGVFGIAGLAIAIAAVAIASPRVAGWVQSLRRRGRRPLP